MARECTLDCVSLCARARECVCVPFFNQRIVFGFGLVHKLVFLEPHPNNSPSGDEMSSGPLLV